MTAFAILALIGLIAMASLLANFRLLDQRRKLRDQVAILEALNEQQAETILDQGYREQKLQEHAIGLIRERTLLRAQLIAYTEPSRFGVVRIGNG